jgi:DNA-directed RNA polymerase specialized sigma subunit
MQHFFYDDTFCSDLEDLAAVLDIDEDNVNELKDDWQVKVELSDLEPIFNVDAEDLCQLLADANEDRLSEDIDVEANVLKALKETINFDKLKDALPKYYYPNNKFKTITKADLVEELCEVAFSRNLKLTTTLDLRGTADAL